jgi:hypothetical protein
LLHYRIYYQGDQIPNWDYSSYLSFQVQTSHYKGFIGGKRVYEKHTVMGINGNKSMGIKKVDNEVILGREAPPKGFEPLTDWLTASRSTGLSHGGTA